MRMANGMTSVFCDVLSLAGSSVAATAWQRQLTLHFCDSERVGAGISGFDLAELPWTDRWPAEKGFFLHVIGLAATRSGWDRLHYDPVLADEYLLAYREMLVAFDPRAVSESPLGDWTEHPRAYEVDLCPRHQVFRGYHGCRLCDVSLQPTNAPTVWELVSSHRVAGELVHQEVRQVPDHAASMLVGSHSSSLTADMASTGLPVGPGLRDRVEATLGVAIDPRWDHVLRLAVS